MSKKKIFIGMGIGAGVLILLPAAFLTLIYFAMFLPNFSRQEGVFSEKKEMVRWGDVEHWEMAKADARLVDALPSETFTIQTEDGITLAAEFIPAKDGVSSSAAGISGYSREAIGKGVVILVHGHTSVPLRDCSLFALFYREQGYSVLMPYLRAHKKSGGEIMTFGILERKDLYDWVTFVDDLFGYEHDVWLHGLSMGSTIALMASGYGLPFNVRGIIADCGYTSPDAIITHFVELKNLPFPGLFTKAANLFVRIKTGVSLSDYSTLDALRVNETPVLFITGSADTYVPVAMTLANFEMCKAKKELYICEGAIHALSVYTDKEKYFGRVSQFLERNALIR